MLPSEVRERVLDDHRVLRAQIERVRGVPPDKGFRAVQEALDTLSALLRANIALEEAILAPELRDTDSFGDVRGRLLREHHAAQRDYVEMCRRRLANPRSTAGTASDFVHAKMDALAADIEEEERTLLDSTILRDDTVTISPSA